jgi:hypothetical protein
MAVPSRARPQRRAPPNIAAQNALSAGRSAASNTITLRTNLMTLMLRTASDRAAHRHGCAHHADDRMLDARCTLVKCGGVQSTRSTASGAVTSAPTRTTASSVTWTRLGNDGGVALLRCPLCQVIYLPPDDGSNTFARLTSRMPLQSCRNASGT